MKIYNFEPNDLEFLSEQMNKIFGDFTTKNYSNHLFSPKIDISEDEKNINLEIELPGCKKDDIKLTFENNSLILTGEKRGPENLQSMKYILNERNFGSFSKKFIFQEKINPEKISADFENGVLKIDVEKIINNTPQERQIKIN